MSIGGVEGYRRVHQQLEQAVEQLKAQILGYKAALDALKDIAMAGDKQGAFKAVTDLGAKLEAQAVAVEALVTMETGIIHTYKTTGWRKVVSKLGFSVANTETQQALRIQSLAQEVRLVAHNTQTQLASGKITNPAALLAARGGHLQDIDRSWPQAKPSWTSYFGALFKGMRGSPALTTQSAPPKILAVVPPPSRSAPPTGPDSAPPPPAREKARPSALAVSSPLKPEPSPWSKDQEMWNKGMSWVDRGQLSAEVRGQLQSLFVPAMVLLGPRQGETTLDYLRALHPRNWQQLFKAMTPDSYQSKEALRDFLLLITSASTPVRKPPFPMPKAPPPPSLPMKQWSDDFPLQESDFFTLPPFLRGARTPPKMSSSTSSSPASLKPEAASKQQWEDFQFSLQHMRSSPEAEAVRKFVNELSPEARQALWKKMIRKGTEVGKPSQVFAFLQEEFLLAQSAAMVPLDEADEAERERDTTQYSKHLASKYERVICQGNGNCMYEAFARGLGLAHPEAAADDLRKELYQYMQENAERLRKEDPLLGGFGGLDADAFEKERGAAKARVPGDSDDHRSAWADLRHARVLGLSRKARVYVHVFFGQDKDQVVSLNADVSGGPEIHLFWSVRHFDYMKPIPVALP